MMKREQCYGCGCEIQQTATGRIHTGPKMGPHCPAISTDAYDRGYTDRLGGKPMAESWNLSPGDANAYRNGYVAACRVAEANPAPGLWMAKP